MTGPVRLARCVDLAEFVGNVLVERFDEQVFDRKRHGRSIPPGVG